MLKLKFSSSSVGYKAKCAIYCHQWRFVVVVLQPWHKTTSGNSTLGVLDAIQ